MKKKIWGVLVVAGVLAAALALFGCSSGSDNSAKSEKDEAPKADTEASAEDYELLNEGSITFATSPDFPPFENLEGGEYVGLDIEIAKAVAAEMGLECKFVTMQFDAILPAIAAGGQTDAGISGFTVDPERALQVDFSDTYYIDDQAICVMDTGEIDPENAIEELSQDGIIIAVQSGTTGETYIQENFPNATVQPYGNSTDCFAALQSGNAQAVCTNLAVVERMLKDAYPDAVVVQRIATGEEYAIAISKDNPGLTAAINEALATLQTNGVIDDLIEQYL